MQEIEPTPEMVESVKKLNEGPLIFVYRDGTVIRGETQHGKDPLVWRGGNWRRMIRRKF